LGKTNLLFFLSLVLFSCTEDPSTIGFKGEDSRFKVYYKELTIPTSVILTDSLTTFNNPDPAFASETKRLLVGKYTDPQFGVIEAEAYTQFRPYNPAFTLPTGSLLDSAVLTLSFDNYYYGDQTTASQNFLVYELLDSIITQQNYYQNSSVAYSPTPIGSSSTFVSPSAFDAYLKNNNDGDATNNHADSLSITLNKDFSQRLFDLASSGTSDYLDFRRFKRIFKGFMIRSEGDEKIVGFDPSYSATGIFKTRMLLYYKYPDPANAGSFLKGAFDYGLFTVGSGFNVLGFSKINASRGGTALGIEENLHKEFYPGNYRYIQGGDPVFTKLDFTNFTKFSDTLPNMIINSAELVIDPLEPQDSPLPLFLGLRVLTEKNRFKYSGLYPAYFYPMIVNDSRGFQMLGEQANPTTITRKYNLILSQNTDGTHKYSEYFTPFFQRLYSYRAQEDRLLKFGLISSFPEMNKSVHRLMFNKDNLKLKIYYTLPSTPKQDK
jgi:hypothetical protein